ncbi:MAG: hypothetical protein IJ661_04025 [Lachnospiraceae bacterium]|nr:hypothetical protein [Lachnospiraceae bacterium]
MRMTFYDLRLLESVDSIGKDSKIVLYGAGDKGKEIYRLFCAAGFSVAAFCDSDGGKVGKEVMDGILCISPKSVRQIGGDNEKIVLIVCIEYPEEAWELFLSFEDREKVCDIRFVTYWGISQWLYQYRTELFRRAEDILWKYEEENILLKLQYKNRALNILRDYLESDGKIWILQPGKVGSTSVQNMLMKSRIPCLHRHVILYPGHAIADLEKEWMEVVERRTKQELKIIVLVRNPLDRDYSAFWQPFRKEGLRSRLIFGGDNSYCMQECYDVFLQKVIMDGRGKEFGLACPDLWIDEFEWFDQELKMMTGIDIYEIPFDRSKGYAVIQKEKTKIFLVKLESLEHCLSALGDFVNADLEMLYDNKASEAWFHMAYKEFRKEVKISRDYVDHYFDGNKKMNHFYTRDEQMGFLEKWKGNIR